MKTTLLIILTISLYVMITEDYFKYLKRVPDGKRLEEVGNIIGAVFRSNPSGVYCHEFTTENKWSSGSTTHTVTLDFREDHVLIIDNLDKTGDTVTTGHVSAYWRKIGNKVFIRETAKGDDWIDYFFKMDGEDLINVVPSDKVDARYIHRH